MVQKKDDQDNGYPDPHVVCYYHQGESYPTSSRHGVTL